MAIKSHLDKVASEDSAFAEKYRTKCEVENDSIEKCCNYIISEVQKLKRQAMTDAEVITIRRASTMTGSWLQSTRT